MTEKFCEGASAKMLHSGDVSVSSDEYRPSDSQFQSESPVHHTVLEVHSVCCGYNEDHHVIENMDFTVDSGEVVCVLGPNGVGKTTLFKSLLGQLPLLGGDVSLNGKDIHSIGSAEMARIVSYVPQAHVPPFPFLVGDVVAMGRTAHMSIFSVPSDEDELIAFDALDKLGIGKLYERPYTEVSGGERQLVLIARALAQQTQLLVMDEPTANLDFGNQVRVLERIIGLAESGLAILMTTHHPDQALQCSTKCIMLESPDSYLVGSAEKIITPESLRLLYGVDVDVLTVDTRAGAETICLPILKRGESR